MGAFCGEAPIILIFKEIFKRIGKRAKFPKSLIQPNYDNLHSYTATEPDICQIP